MTVYVSVLDKTIKPPCVRNVLIPDGWVITSGLGWRQYLENWRENAKRYPEFYSIPLYAIRVRVKPKYERLNEHG